MAMQIVVPKRGGPEVLVEREAPPLRPGPGEVLIRVKAAGVNFADLLGRMGLYPEAPPFPYCPGYEAAGVVEARGTDTDRFAEGDRVVAFTRFGGYADRALTLESMTFPLSGRIPFEAGAAFPVNFATADLALFAAGRLRDGDRVLVLGGAGGVGSAAVRLCRRRDVTVLATAGSPEKIAFLAAEGVHHPIAYREADVREEVMRATGGEGVDLVLDPVGGRTLARSLTLLAPLGRVVAYGASELAPGRKRSLWRVFRTLRAFPRPRVTDLMMENRGIHGLNLLPLFGRADLAERFREELLPRLASGEIGPVIHRILPLTAEGAAEAHRELHERRNIGKVVLVR
jgi:NADPH:quinone reductase-like Zn-dependent oxidoreductase